MKITVPDEVLRRTTRCPNDFSCLTDGACGKFPACSCSPGTSYDKYSLFVKTKNIINISLCPYELSFRFEYICLCPTHAALLEELEKIKQSSSELEIKENTVTISSKATSKAS